MRHHSKSCTLFSSGFALLPVSSRFFAFRPVPSCPVLFRSVLSCPVSVSVPVPSCSISVPFCSGISAASVRLGPNRRFSPQSERLRREDAGGGGCGGGCIMLRATVFDRTFRAVCPGVASVWRMRACAGVFSRSWMVRCAAIGLFRNLRPRRVCGRCVCRNIGKIFVNLYEEYTSLKSRKLEELPRFRVMSWRPF